MSSDQAINPRSGGYLGPVFDGEQESRHALGGADSLPSYSTRSGLVSGGGEEGTDLTTVSYNSGDTSSSATFGALPHAKHGAIDIAIMVTSLAVEGQETGSKTVQVIIQMKEGQMASLNATAMKQIAEAVEAMSKSSKSGSFGKVFGWIAVAATLVVATITVNPALAAVAIMAITMMALQESGHMQKLAEEIGTEAFIAVMIIIAVLMIVVPFIAPAALGGAASAGTAAASTAAQASKMTAMTNMIANNAARIRTVGAAIEGGATGVSGGAQIDSAKYRHRSETLSADSDRSIAEHDKAAEYISQAVDFFIDFMERHERNKQYAREIVRDVHESNKVVADSRS